MYCDVLVVEDDEDLRGAMVEGLEHEGLRVCDAGTPEAALAAVQAHRPLVLVSDMMLDGGGTDVGGLLRSLRALERGPRLSVILVSGARDVRRHATRLGAMAVVPKPFTVAQLMTAMRPLLAPAPIRGPQLAPSSARLAL